jgi:hypothetical protein
MMLVYEKLLALGLFDHSSLSLEIGIMPKGSSLFVHLFLFPMCRIRWQNTYHVHGVGVIMPKTCWGTFASRALSGNWHYAKTYWVIIVAYLYLFPMSTRLYGVEGIMTKPTGSSSFVYLYLFQL